MRTNQIHRTLYAALLSLPLAAVNLACEQPCGDCRLSNLEWDVVQTLSPLPAIPVDPTNKYQFNDAAARFGQRLFFDKRYSGAIRVPNNGSNGGPGLLAGTRQGAMTSTSAGQVACVSCHDSKKYFVDTRSVPGNMSLGSAYTVRHSPTVVNLPFYKWWGVGGRHDSMWMQASLSPEAGTDTASDRCKYAHFIWQYHREEYNSIFTDTPLPAELDPSHPNAARFPALCRPKANAMAPDGNWEKMPAEDKKAVLQIMANQGKAVVAYENKLISGNAPFDKYVAGDQAAISDAAVRGLRLFVGKAACIDCHNTALFSDSLNHNLGVPQEGLNVPKEDLGHFLDVGIWLGHPFNSASAFSDDPSINKVAGVMQKEEYKGKFRTPSLRGIALTFPYMHTGNFNTLSDVLWFYNEGGGASSFVGQKSDRLRPLLLTDDEIADLIEFLESLTGEPIPDQWTCDPAPGSTISCPTP